MTGRHVYTMQAVLQTVDPATGLLADAVGAILTADFITTTGSSTAAVPTITAIQGLCDEIENRPTREEEEISALNDTHANHVVLAQDWTLVVTEILRQGVNTCLWANLWNAVDGAQNLSKIVRATFARSGNKWTGYALMKSYPEMIRRGKTTGRMTLVGVDPGVPNPAYATGDR
jgi:hypothetical protein